mmetsp:Transcript_11345/g.18115  ORF Transcript_11345/g.18115 Transcript_11345/m.18115 type:complete len:143 (-) Transcript_11345:378-806(-)
MYGGNYFLAGARGNIFLNQDRESKFKYIEVNKSEIRLEFQDTDSSIYQVSVKMSTVKLKNKNLQPLYQYYIERWTERSEYGTVKPSMDSISESSDIRDLVIDVRNNTFCGAGATVLLCKQGFISFLKRNLNMPHLEEVSQLS